MQYLFLLLVLVGCASPKAGHKQKTNIIIKKIDERANSLFLPWTNLKPYQGTVNSAEEFFSQEELQQYTNLKEWDSLPPLWEKIHLINTNTTNFPLSIWETLEWQKGYKLFAKTLPKNLSPKEATLALSNYVDKLSSLSKDEEIFYAFYHFGEMGANFNYKLDAYTNSFEDKHISFSEHIPQKYGIRGFLYARHRSDFTPANPELQLISLQMLEYLLNKNLSLEYFYESPGIADVEILKYLVSRGLDFNKMLFFTYDGSSPTQEKTLYYNYLEEYSPYAAHLIIALGYTNEVQGFMLSNYYEERLIRMDID